MKQEQTFRTYKRNGIYYVSYDKGKKAKWTSTGLRNYAEVVSRFKNASSLPLLPSQSLRLSEFIDTFIERVSPRVRAGTLRGYRLALSQFLDAIGNKRISEIDANDIFRFADRRSKDNVEPVTVNIGLRYVHSALTRAKTWGFIQSVPPVELLRVEKRPPVYLSMEEVGHIANKASDETLGWLFILTFFTGCRLSEIVNLPWSHVDLKNRQITVAAYKDFQPKTGKSRVIPVRGYPLAGLSILSTMQRREFGKKLEYVFTHSGKKYAPLYVSRRFKEACKKAGLGEEYHFHTLRHSFASYLINRGVSLYMVQALLGHSQSTTTEIYSHLAPSTLRKAIEAFEPPEKKNK